VRRDRTQRSSIWLSEEDMKTSQSLNRLRGLGVAGAMLVVAALAVLAGPGPETASSSVGSIVHDPTRPPHWLLRQLNPPAHSADSQPSNQLRVSAAYHRLPLYFEANRGQTDPQVKFLSRGSGHTLFLTGRAETVLVLGNSALRRPPAQPTDRLSAIVKPEPEVTPPAVLRMKLVGARLTPRVEGLDELPGKANYFTGNDPTKWRANIPLYAKVRYRDVYPGVDLVYYGNQRQLEHDFIVAPGADPRSITMAFEGTKKLSLDARGNRVIAAGDGEVLLGKPTIYQEVDGTRKEISGRYVLKGAHQVSLRVAAYDAGRPLIIDPVLFYSTYLGGSYLDLGFAIAVDTAGNAYVTGSTASINFPTTSGAFQTTLHGGRSAFVTKLNPTGSGLVYSTYLGGSSDSRGFGIAVDTLGNAYVTGLTSGASNFPTTLGAFQTTPGGPISSAFVTKLNPTGSGLVYSTYLGGSSSGADRGSAIAVDTAGNAYVTGSTGSTHFPTTAGAFQSTLGGMSNAFVTKVNPLGTGLVYSTYLGGNGGNDDGFGIAVDTAGNAYVTGDTHSIAFPTTVGAFQTTPGAVSDAFVTKVNPLGTGLVYSTYLGGNGFDVGKGIAVDNMPNPNAYVTGSTDSTDFPTTPGAFQTVNAGNGDGFVTKVNPLGSGLVYSSYLGGSGFDEGLGIAVDTAGNAYVTGDTQSSNSPTVAAIQSTPGGSTDAFVTTVNPAGSGLVYSTYLGGSGADQGFGIALDALPNPNAYVAGNTSSTNFSTTSGAFQTTYGGAPADAFVSKITNITLPPGPTVGKVTGGGTINVTGGIGNFGFIVQAKSTSGPISGDLQYVNHATGAKVHSVMFTTFVISGNTATFGGTCTNNGAPCTFNVTVQDNDQPPGPDSFVISVNGGPPEGGTLRSGNIEIH
jgi:hypothetical protein